MHRWFFILGILFYSFSALAQFDPKLQRYSVKVGSSKKPKFMRVGVELQISDAQQISFERDFILLQFRSKGKTVKRKFTFNRMGILKPEPKIGDLGLVRFVIQVPRKKMVLRMPMIVTATDGTTFRYELAVSILKKPYNATLIQRGVIQKSEARLAKEAEDITPQEEIKASGEEAVDYSKVRKRFGSWLGVGYNYVDYQQSNVNPTSKSVFSTALPGSLYFDFEYRFSLEWMARFEYKSSPGAVTTDPSDTQSVGGNYTWTTLTPEVIYVNRDANFDMFGKKFIPFFRFGIQSHTVPWLVNATGVNGSNEEITFVESISSIGLTNLSFGGGVTWKGVWKPVYEFFMRYQYTLSSSGDFEISPGFMFDGSLGMSFPFKSGLKLGAYWYGQLHTFKYTHSGSEAAAKPTGDEQLFYSNIDFRIGFDF